MSPSARLALLCALAASVSLVAPAPEAFARGDGAEASAEPGVKKSRSSSRSSRDVERPRKRRYSDRDPNRKPNRRTATNVPSGWSWPPTKRMRAAGERCKEALTEAGIGWEAAKREGRIVTPIVLDSMTIAGIEYRATFRRPPFVMDCELALALVTYGPDLYDLGVRQVNFGSIFRFTKVRAYGKTKNILSRHAFGLAMDIVSFVDAEGRVAKVQGDYLEGDPLLLSIEETLNSSNGFRTVLTPSNDPESHYDHFHVEARIEYTSALDF